MEVTERRMDAGAISTHPCACKRQMRRNLAEPPNSLNGLPSTKVAFRHRSAPDATHDPVSFFLDDRPATRHPVDGHHEQKEERIRPRVPSAEIQDSGVIVAGVVVCRHSVWILRNALDRVVRNRACVSRAAELSSGEARDTL